MKVWHLYDKVYRAWVCIVVSSRDEFVDFIDGCGYKDMDFVRELVGGGQGAMMRITPADNEVGNNCVVVWMQQWRAATLVHEISHLTSQILSDCLVPVNHDNTEAIAFYSEFWWTEINRAKRRWPDGNKHSDVQK
jgi:hypothetical protein